MIIFTAEVVRQKKMKTGNGQDIIRIAEVRIIRNSMRQISKQTKKCWQTMDITKILTTQEAYIEGRIDRKL